jgi:hypothetical protein
MGFICGWWAIILKRSSLESLYFENILRKKLLEIKENMEFAMALIEGNFDKTLNTQSEMSESLVTLKNNLKNSQEAEKDNKLRQKTLLDISIILRDNTNLKEMSKKMLAYFIKILDAQQGSVYLTSKLESTQGNTTEVILLPIVTQAWNEEQKSKKSSILLGEGIAGQSLKSQEVIYWEDIPENFYIIRTGLGEAKVKSILALPLVFGEQKIGVIEIASLKTIEKQKQELVASLLESIVTTILALQAAQKTQQFLLEAQAANEPLRSQEEELNQNLEESNTMREILEVNTKEFEMRLKQKDEEIENLKQELSNKKEKE